LVKRCAGFRPSTNRSVDHACTRAAMRAVAQRIIHLNEEITTHEQALTRLIDQAAPQLVAEIGIGPITAAAFYIAWSHPGRCRNEAAYARLAGGFPHPGHLRPNPATSPTQPARRPATQQGTTPGRGHQTQMPPTNPGLQQKTLIGRQNRSRNPTLPQTLHRPQSLATTRTPNTTRNRHSTDIEASTRPADAAAHIAG